jgi:hypothetical protein
VFLRRAGAALETSLMENTIRAATHPADEFVAMAALIDTSEKIETVAARFNITERHVPQRLRLSKVAPELLDEFHAGKLSLEAMTAFTLGADDACSSRRGVKSRRRPCRLEERRRPERIEPPPTGRANQGRQLS